MPEVFLGDRSARVVRGSSTAIDVLVPRGSSDRLSIRIDGVAFDSASAEIAVPLATGLHQVDGPVFDAQGNLYVTYSGSRGQQVPVSVFRVRPNGTRETFSSSVVNPTSMAIDGAGRLYISSRFEGTVYRLREDGLAEPFATELGVACGLVFAPDGTLIVGDRSGTIFKVDEGGRALPFATLPPSVAAFHLALADDGTLFVSGPTLASYDCIFEVSRAGAVTTRPERFGRPQGLAIDSRGRLLVVEALAGASGVYRLHDGGPPQLLVSGPGLVGVARAPDGPLVVASADTAYRLSPIP